MNPPVRPNIDVIVLWSLNIVYSLCRGKLVTNDIRTLVKEDRFTSRVYVYCYVYCYVQRLRLYMVSNSSLLLERIYGYGTDLMSWEYFLQLILPSIIRQTLTEIFYSS